MSQASATSTSQANGGNIAPAAGSVPGWVWFAVLAAAAVAFYFWRKK